jgi:hypothetical protein
MATGSALFATLVYYLVLLMSLLAGNALSVLGGVDLIEPLYNTVHKVHPIVVNVVSRVCTRLQHFKLFKVNHGPKDAPKSSEHKSTNQTTYTTYTTYTAHTTTPEATEVD